MRMRTKDTEVFSSPQWRFFSLSILCSHYMNTPRMMSSQSHSTPFFSMKSEVSPCFAFDKIWTKLKYTVTRIQEWPIYKSTMCMSLLFKARHSAYLPKDIVTHICFFFTNDTEDQSV